MTALLDVAEAAARAAAPLLLERFGTERPSATKSSPTDLVSEADLAAERAIRAVLRERVPDDAILGEEGDDVSGTTGRRWIVDPIDGTINYLFGIPQWCISVACEDLAGVIYDPVRDELFAAAADGPATLNGAPLTASDCDDLALAMVATGFGYEAERRRLQAAVLADLLPRVRDIRRFGSAALDLAWSAAGRYDAYYERGVQLWDIAAGEIIAARAGLSVRRLEPRGELPMGVLAAPAAIIEELAAAV